MPLDLTLRLLRAPAIGPTLLHAPLQRLAVLRAEAVAKFGEGGESQPFIRRKDEMRKQLKRRIPLMRMAQEAGGQRVLISLYIEDYGQQDAAAWLPRFDAAVASALLGPTGAQWHSSRRTQAAQLFFHHYDQLEALAVLSERLGQAFGQPGTMSERDAVWAAQAESLFATDGAGRLARAAQEGETLSTLEQRFRLPSEGRFATRLKETLLLAQLQHVPIGGGLEVLKQIESPSVRDAIYEPGIPLGAAALRVMTRRVLASGGTWPAVWTDCILRLGCDPSLPALSKAYGKWWGCWNPTPAELRCAQRALNRQTLEYFIQFLEASLRQSGQLAQFESRARFLRWLDDSHKIEQFKLILHPAAHRALPLEYRQQRHRIAQLSPAGQGTSIIVMKCSDEMWIVEGTHSYAVRAFRSDCPQSISAVLDMTASTYDFDLFSQGPMHRDSPQGIWKAHMHDWLQGLLEQIGRKYRVEWRYQQAAPVRRAPVATLRPAPVAINVSLTGEALKEANRWRQSCNLPPLAELSSQRSAQESPPEKPAPPASSMMVMPQANRPPASAPTIATASRAGANAVGQDVGGTVNAYIDRLSSYLTRQDKVEALPTRMAFLHKLLDRRKINAALMIDTFDQNEAALVMICDNGITLVDGVHYYNLRGVHNTNRDLWASIAASVPNPAPCWQFLKSAEYPLKVPFFPSASFASRFLDDLATVCGVEWDDVIF